MKRKAVYIISALLLSACEGFLDEKPSKDIVVPSTLQDLKAMLDNTSTMNMTSGISVIGTDDIEIPADGLASLVSSTIEGNSYLWKKDVLEGSKFLDWNENYFAILTSNIVLDQLQGIQLTELNKGEWEVTYGSALFYRAYRYYDLMRLFAPQIDSDNKAEKLGVPLRLTSDITSMQDRASLQECYEQIKKDLLESITYLPDTPQTYLTRPSKWAAYGLLSRMSLQLGEYELALDYTQRCLAIGDELIDYSVLDSEAVFPIPQFNKEVIFHSVMIFYSYLSRPMTYIHPDLIALYGDGDLRFDVFFRPRIEEGKFNFKGNYTGTADGFSGIAVDEIHLIQAESLIRTGKVTQGIEVLNRLLETRWDKEGYQPLLINDYNSALKKVIEERQKTLVYRGTRWDDLKRLNKEPELQQTITRNMDGEIYTLLPNSPRYAYPIPQQELDLNPIPQNIRGN